ncbi:MAG: hypothetical protein K0S00_4874 [Xanthobacteraceae bacterium]|nr:hypothetical protein [Xanthobacteraceae bacterium]
MKAEDLQAAVTAHWSARAPVFDGPVIAPAEIAGEVGYRHQLDRGDAEFFQEAEILRCGGKGALRREGADMHLVEHVAGRRQSRPFLVRPGKRGRIDHCRGAIHTHGLETRGEVGKGSLPI